jgi:molecular chaperone GrpE
MSEDDVKKSSHEGKSAHASSGSKKRAPAEPASNTNEPDPVDNSSRMDAAKAFYRAIYAGDETSAEKYGMKVDTINNQAVGVGGCVNCDQLAAEFEQAQAKTAEIEGLYKRMAADFDNYRKRIEREREDLVDIGVQRAVEALLPALDDLDRAQANFNNSSELSTVIESLKLISARFTKCLEQLGIKPLEPIGQHFDPRLHEPVQQIVSTEAPDGTVIHDLRRGYALREKIIRPTLVNVAIADTGDQSGATEIDNEKNDSQPTSSAEPAESSQ